MRTFVFAVIITLIILAGLPLFAAGDAAAGKDAYMKKCASCHGPDGLRFVAAARAAGSAAAAGGRARSCSRA